MLVQLLLRIVAILFYTTYASGCGNTAGCVIIENPKTSVIKYNDTVVVTCAIIDNDDIFRETIMIFDKTLTNDEAFILKDRGITNINCGQTICTATVLGNEMNNGLEMHCLVGGCCTESAIIYVVDGIPDPPDPPVVTFINTMSLNISWSSPWNSSRIPVNNYTLIITDNNTGIQDTMITTDTYYVFEKQDNVSCEDVYLVTVSADTDLGETNKSDSSLASFLSDIDDLLAVNYSFIDTYSIYQCGAKKPTYQIKGINPDLCPHETLQYSFSHSVPKSQNKNGNNPLLIVPDATVPVFYFQNGSGVCEDGVCSVWETIIVNQVNDTRLVKDKFDFSSAFETNEIKDIVHPVTTVALINTNVTFVCMSGDNDDINATIILIINGVPVNSSMEDELEHDMVYYEDGYFITITADKENNNTKVQCFILPCFTEEAVLIVVESPPDPVDPPVTIINNDTSILITWSPPWVHPVNMYYVIVTDITKERNLLIGNYSVKDTHYCLTNTSGFECSILSVTVQAVTDVDTTDPSNATTIPVYIGLKNSHVIESTKTYAYTKGNDLMPPSLTISFESPTVCDHEVLTYQFKLKDLLPPFNEVVRNSGGNSSAVIELSSYLFHDDVLMVSVEVNVSDGYTSMIIPLYDNITMTETPPTNSGTSGGSDVIVVVICVIMAFIIIFLILVLCLSCYWYRRLMKAKRSRIVDTVIGDSGFNFSLPPMVVNAQYSTAEDVLYETIHDMTIEPYDTVAPRLPPPRPLSQKLADMSYKEEQEFESQLISKKLDGEYIQMNGTTKADSPRYVKAPSLANSLSKTGEAIVPTGDDDDETIATTAFIFEPIEDNPT